MGLVVCSVCLNKVSNEFQDCPSCGCGIQSRTVATANSARGTSTTVARFNGSQVEFSVSTKADAKLAIRELRLKKKEFQMQKRDLRAQQKALRANYTHVTRTRMPLVRGRGFFSSFIRLGQANMRSAARAELATDIMPIESEIARIDRRIAGLDSLVMKLEAFILQQRS
jgi:hypothetical protein